MNDDSGQVLEAIKRLQADIRDLNEGLFGARDGLIVRVSLLEQSHANAVAELSKHRDVTADMRTAHRIITWIGGTVGAALLLGFVGLLIKTLTAAS